MPAFNSYRQQHPDQKISLQRTNLQGADLQKANLQGADLRKADLQGADLRGAKLQGANLRRATLTNEQLKIAKRDDAITGDNVIVEATVKDEETPAETLPETITTTHSPNDTVQDHTRPNEAIMGISQITVTSPTTYQRRG